MSRSTLFSWAKLINEGATINPKSGKKEALAAFRALLEESKRTREQIQINHAEMQANHSKTTSGIAGLATGAVELKGMVAQVLEAVTASASSSAPASGKTDQLGMADVAMKDDEGETDQMRKADVVMKDDDDEDDKGETDQMEADEMGKADVAMQNETAMETDEMDKAADAPAEAPTDVEMDKVADELDKAVDAPADAPTEAPADEMDKVADAPADVKMDKVEYYDFKWQNDPENCAEMSEWIRNGMGRSEERIKFMEEVSKATRARRQPYTEAKAAARAAGVRIVDSSDEEPLHDDARARRQVYTEAKAAAKAAGVQILDSDDDDARARRKAYTGNHSDSASQNDDDGDDAQNDDDGDDAHDDSEEEIAVRLRKEAMEAYVPAMIQLNDDYITEKSDAQAEYEFEVDSAMEEMRMALEEARTKRDSRIESAQSTFELEKAELEQKLAHSQG